MKVLADRCRSSAFSSTTVSLVGDVMVTKWSGKDAVITHRQYPPICSLCERLFSLQ